ncbi:MAG: hypothetical protein IGS03_17370 [Candidatus Sericytochromatia bacterium]|nr:hypothetical protein [Candidatus Sericytochromatia bacterium]
MIRDNNPFQNQISALPQSQNLNRAAVAPAQGPQSSPATETPAAPQPQLPLTSQNAASVRAQASFDPGSGLFSRLNNARAQDPESMGASVLRIVNALRASQQQTSPSVLDDIASKLSAIRDRLTERGDENTASQESTEATEPQMVTFPSFGNASSEVQEAEQTESDSNEVQEAEQSESDSNEVQEAEQSESDSNEVQEAGQSESDSNEVQEAGQSESDSNEVQEAGQSESDSNEVQEAEQSESDSNEVQEAEQSESDTSDEDTSVSGGAAAVSEPNMTFRSEQNTQNNESDALADYQLQVRKRIERTLDQLANTRVFQNSEVLREIREKLADI